MDRGNKLDDLRTIVEKVEQKAHVPADDPNIVALKEIVGQKIAQIEGGGRQPIAAPSPAAPVEGEHSSR